MSITPNSNVFTALSLTDIAKPLPRAAAQGVQRPASDVAGRQPVRPGDVEDGQNRKRAADDGAKFRQAVSQNGVEAEDGDNDSGQPQVAEDFRREAVAPRRPTFQKLGQLVDLSI